MDGWAGHQVEAKLNQLKEKTEWAKSNVRQVEETEAEFLSIFRSLDKKEKACQNQTEKGNWS